MKPTVILSYHVMLLSLIFVSCVITCQDFRVICQRWVQTVFEKYFSRNGQWPGNHHTYDFGTMFNNLNHMIRIEQIEDDNNSPKFLRNHRKQENVWKKQYQESPDMASVLLVQNVTHSRSGRKGCCWRMKWQCQ